MDKSQPRDPAVYGAVERFINQTFGLTDAAATSALDRAAAAGLPGIEISAGQGRLLTILALVVGARRIPELARESTFDGMTIARVK